MRTIQVDDDVYRSLEAHAQGFSDSPNAVLRRVLGVGPKAERSSAKLAVRAIRSRRGKAPKTNLRDLVRVGSLSEGQKLFMHDYQGNRIDGVQANVSGNSLEFEGELLSMSALTRNVMQRQGYQSDSYRGPHFWFTAEGKSVRELWDEYLKTCS